VARQFDRDPEGRSRMSQENGPEGQRTRLFLRFWASASGFWKGKSARLSWPLTLALIAIVLAQLMVQYKLNYWNRDFFNALERRNGAALWDQALIFAPLAGLSIALAVASVWGRMTMQRKWREWLTTHLIGLTNFLYQRDGEIIAFARLDLAVAGTGLSSAVPVVDIRAMSAA
jgi:ABC-type uncharacterized transport system fused permease/ATPase subunit